MCLAGSLLSLSGGAIAVETPIQPLAERLRQPIDRNSATSVIQEIAQNSVLTQAEIYKLRNQVELQPANQTARTAKLADVLRPQDAVRTAAASIAELLFNEGSIARVDANTVFRFRQGLRSFQLENRVSQQPLKLAADDRLKLSPQFSSPQSGLSQFNSRQLIAQTPVLQQETIFVLESGRALLMSPPNSVGTQVETPESQIRIIALQSIGGTVEQTPTARSDVAPSGTPSSTASGLLLPPKDSSAVMVVHDRDNSSTRVYALTDGDIRVFDRAGNDSTPLIGGQTVAITNGQLGPVEEFDLEAFYRTVALAEGLGPGQESFVTSEPQRVQITLNAVRIETLAAVKRQQRERSTFTGTFLRDALSGSDSDFEGQRARRNAQVGDERLIIGGERSDGRFVRRGEVEGDIIRGFFIPDNDPNNRVPIRVNTDDRSAIIDGERGVSNDARLSGDDGVGTVQLENGRVESVRIFNIRDDVEDEDFDSEYRGRIIRGGILPDRGFRPADR